MDPQSRPSSPEAQPPRSSPALPPLPSLEHLKKQAKHLLAAARRGDPQALQRLRRWFPERPALALSQAQLAVAREHGCTGWAQLRRAVLDALVARLAVHHWTQWRAAAAARAALVCAGEDGLAAVLEGLAHPEPRVRRGAADFLSHRADARGVAGLTDLVLHDPVPYVRWSALQALKRHVSTSTGPGADLTPVLLRAAQQDPSPRVRWRAVGGLPTPELARAAREDVSPRVRRWALGALGGRAGSELARQTLEVALRDPQPDARRAAHQALRRLSPEYRRLAARRARAANLAPPGAAGPAA